MIPRGVRRGVTVGLALLVASLGLALPNAAVGAVVPATPFTWGGNSFGELGDGTTAPRLHPGAVTGGLSDVVDVHSGREHVITLRADGTVWVWGSNQHGQLGLGGSLNRSTPTRVPSLSGVTAVETGHNHGLALLGDGTVWTWGLNSDGQLGDGTTTLRRTPIRVGGLSDAVAIAAGRNMTYAIRANGQLVGWGRNAEGQLGDGTTTRRPAPVRVGSLTDVVGVAGGRDHGLAVRGDGSVWAWGANSYGQVGDGTTTHRTAPVPVTTGVAEVIAGAHHSYARRTDGQVMSWGRNYRSALGDGTTLQRTRPVAVVGVTSAVSIGAGRDHGVAVLDDGSVRAWGHNAQGQVGDGSTISRSQSVVVPGVSGAVKAGGGGAEYSVVLVGSGGPPVNAPPVARFSWECDQLDCSFDAAASTDDGGIAAYAWEFGDGATATGVAATYRYTTGGDFDVTLTVIDDEGLRHSITWPVTVTAAPPPGEGLRFRGQASSNANTVQPGVVVPAGVQADDRLLLFAATNRAAVATTPVGWTLLGTVADGADMRSWAWTRTATPGTAGSVVRVQLDATSKTAMTVLAYDGAGAVTAAVAAAEAGNSAVHLAPASTSAVAGSTAVRFWADKTSTVHGWTVPPVVTVRGSTTGAGGGLVTSVAGDTAGLPAGVVPAVAATAEVASAKAVAWTVVLAPE